MRMAMITAVLVALAGSIDGAAAQSAPPHTMPGTTPNLPIDPNRPYFGTTGKLLRVGTGLAADGLYLTLDVDTADNICKIKSGLFMDRANAQYRETVSIVLLSLAQARPIDVYHYGECYGPLVKLVAVAIQTGP